MRLEVAASPVRALITTDPARLYEVSAEWCQLWERDPSATVFASPDWAICWWEHFGRPPLRLVELRSGERLVGILPLFLPEQLEPAGPRLLLAGTGNTDHLDPAFDPALDDAAAHAALGVLRELSQERGVDLRQLRTDSPLVRAARERGWSVVDDENCPVLDLAGCDGLASVMPTGPLQSLRYARRRAAATGELTWVSAERAGVADLLAVLFALHEVRWSPRGHSAALSEARTRAFHLDVARRWAGRGLRLLALRIDDRWVAAHYGFRRGKSELYYIGGYDPVNANLSPWSLMLGRVIEEAIHDGVRTFDFLRGREEYTYRWGASDRACARVVMPNR